MKTAAWAPFCTACATSHGLGRGSVGRQSWLGQSWQCHSSRPCGVGDAVGTLSPGPGPTNTKPTQLIDHLLGKPRRRQRWAVTATAGASRMPLEVESFGLWCLTQTPELPPAFLSAFGELEMLRGRMQSWSWALSGVKTQRKVPSNPTKMSLQPHLSTEQLPCCGCVFGELFETITT